MLVVTTESRPRPSRGTKKQEEAKRPEEKPAEPFTALQEVGFATMRRNLAKRAKKA
jgi:hypothetical protein